MSACCRSEPRPSLTLPGQYGLTGPWVASKTAQRKARRRASRGRSGRSCRPPCWQAQPRGVELRTPVAPQEPPRRGPARGTQVEIDHEMIFLLDEERPDVFTASLGNLPSDAEVLLRMTNVTERARNGDDVRFTLPTTVSPRYAPAAPTHPPEPRARRHPRPRHPRRSGVCLLEPREGGVSEIVFARGPGPLGGAAPRQ